MPIFNKERFIEKAIGSVLNQTYMNWELILVDDASGPACIEITEQLAAKDHRIMLVKNNRNMGASHSRNKALKISKGTYIAFLDADDFWDPKFLSKMVAFSKITASSFCYSSFYITNQTLEKQYFVPPQINRFRSLIRSPFACLSVLIFRERLEHQLYFDESLQTHEDFDLWLRILSEVGTAKGIQEPLAYYRQVSGSSSGNKIANFMDRWFFLRNNLKFGYAYSVFFLFSYIIFGFLKYAKLRFFSRATFR